MRNAINWFEIPATDIDRARAFYEAILDIEMHSMNIGEDTHMALFPMHEGKVSGALISNAEFYEPSNSKGPLLYLNGDPDLQLVLDRVEENGGSIHIQKQQISEENGYMAVIEDSEGNRIALHSNG